MSRIDVQPIQKAVLDYIEIGNSWTGICKDLDWYSSGRPDTSRLQRAIGVRNTMSSGNSHSKTYTYSNKKIDEDIAATIVEAIGRSPLEFGL